MKNSATRDALLVVIAVIAVLAPFLNKAFHIDDPLFLWIAQQITRHPQDPYGFDVNWYVTSQPMFWVMQNPPLNSYYMALLGSFAGWSEVAMHTAFLLPAVAAVLGTFFLARRFCRSPLLVALLLLFTPVFLVSATGVMCDVWLLACWVWSVECWMRGLERSSAWLLFLSSILVAAAALTKYFGVALVPLLAVYAVIGERRRSYAALYLLIPILIVVSYELTTRAIYGHGLFSSAMLVSWNENAKPGRHLFQQLLTGLSFTGGCLFSVLFFAFITRQNGLRQAGSQAAESGRMPNFRILTAAIVIFAVSLVLFHFGAARPALPLTIAAEGALFVTVAIGILTLALADILQHKTADSLLLGLWVFGTFIFAAMMNWTITARTFLPMAPAVVILVIRRLHHPPIVAAAVPVVAAAVPPVASAVPGGSSGKDSAPKPFGATTWWPILPAAVLSLLIAVGDYHLANTARVAASDFQRRFDNDSASVWFEGHWGFQYYMQQWRAKSLDAKNRQLVAGDILVVPLDNTNVGRTSPAPTIGPAEEVNYPQFFVATMNPEIHAGFYASNWGPLPWVVGPVPPERYLIFHIK